MMVSWDLPWEFHKVYPSFDVQNIHEYPNHFSAEWRESFRKFSGDPTLTVTHVVNCMKYASKLNVLLDAMPPLQQGLLTSQSLDLLNLQAGVAI
jgi:hypothetical protein